MIYFIKCHDAVKIGHTESLETRIPDLQVGNPYPLATIALLDGGYQLEAQLHRIFSAYRVRGEWFLRAPVDVFLGDVGAYGLDCALGKAQNSKDRAADEMKRQAEDRAVKFYDIVLRALRELVSDVGSAEAAKLLGCTERGLRENVTGRSRPTAPKVWALFALLPKFREEAKSLCSAMRRPRSVA